MVKEKDEMLRICRQISASLIRLKRQMRELADDVTQIRDKVTDIERKIDRKTGGKDENM